MRVSGSANQQLKCAACGPGAEKRSENSAGGYYRAQQLSFEIFRDQIGNCHRSPAQDAVHIALTEIAQGASGFEHAPEIAAAGVVDVRWSGGEGFGDYFADLGQRFSELRIFGCVFL